MQLTEPIWKEAKRVAHVLNIHCCRNIQEEKENKKQTFLKAIPTAAAVSWKTCSRPTNSVGCADP